MLLVSSAGHADIYRYQDAQGVWHFTDDPPPGADLVPGYEWTEKKKAAQGDLASQLERGFEAVTPIARATLSVVTIKSELGAGSGFFCTDQGHILTVLHVIRPSVNGGFQAREETLKGQEGELDTLETELREGQEALRLMEKDLEGYQRVIDKAGDATARQWAEENHARITERYRSEKARLRESEQELAGMKRELRRDRRDLSFERSAEAAASVFEIILKDGTELSASVMETDEEANLALLKLEGFITPHLRLDHLLSLSQGQRVFAIGNPLGMNDAITSGAITGMTPESIHTDIQITPGNSGGPLITEVGTVVGINVGGDGTEGDFVYSGSVGKSIPVRTAMDAFPRIREIQKETLP